MFAVLMLCLVVSLNVGSVKSSLTVQRSQVVLIGERVEMNCSVHVSGSDLTRWVYTSWNTSHEARIYLNTEGNIVESMRSRYRIDKRISGQHNLIIDSVDLAHAGRYRCNGATQGTLWRDVQLFVLASHPVCAANISATQDEGKENRHPALFIWCSVIYTGVGLPVFNWTRSNADKNIVANTTTPGSKGGPVIKTSSFAEQLQYNDSGVAIQCQITFQMRNNYTYMYEGVHVYTWNYTLPYGPRNIRIAEYADRLECSADGNPTPTYTWIGVDSKRSIEGPVFILDGKDQTVQCTATNVFATERKNYTTKSVFRKAFTSTNASDFTDRRSVCGLHAVELLVIAAIAIVFGIVLLIIGLKLRKLSIAFDKVVDKTSTKESSFQPHQSSKKLSSPQPTDEYAEIERADASDNTYCALADQLTTAQKTEVYCELRPVDQRNIKQSAKPRVANKDR